MMLLPGVEGVLSDPLDRAYEMLLCLLACAERPKMLLLPMKLALLLAHARDILEVGEKLSVSGASPSSASEARASLARGEGEPDASCMLLNSVRPPLRDELEEVAYIELGALRPLTLPLPLPKLVPLGPADLERIGTPALCGPSFLLSRKR